MITGGFGFEYDPKRGVSRAWVYKGGIKRWADTGKPVEPPETTSKEPKQGEKKTK